VLRAARAMRDAHALTLLADDPVALTDVPALAQARGWSSRTEKLKDHFAFHLTDDQPNEMNRPR